MFKLPSLNTALFAAIASALNLLVITSHLTPPTLVSAATIVDDTPVTRKVVVLNFDPIMENLGGIRLHEHFPVRTDPHDVTSQVTSVIPTVSHGYLNYNITEFLDLDLYLPKPDGFIYTDESYLACWQNHSTCHNPDIIDYQRLFTDYNICSKNVDEVWLWGGPYFGYHEFYASNTCGRTIFVMGFSYSAGFAESIHNFGHRMEYVGIRRVGGGNDSTWAQDEANEWNKFSLIAGHCGNVHNPPGAPEGYNYSKTNLVTTDCDGNLNFPFGPFTPQQINCTNWGCSHEGFLLWWLSHIPANTGYSTFNSKAIYHNWWKYFANFDETQGGIGLPTISYTSSLKYPANATFDFPTTGSNSYNIDLSTVADMSTDVYLSFGTGPSNPITVTNPTKWDKYSCGRPLYWRVRTATTQSSIKTSLVECITPTITPTPTPIRHITITSPNGGETIYIGDVYRITWVASPNIDSVSLSWSTGPGSSNPIVSSLPNTGYYDWLVSVPASFNQLKISTLAYQVGVGQASDQSDDFFTLLARPTPTLTPTPTPTPLPTPTPTIVPTPFVSPTNTPTIAPTPTPLPTTSIIEVFAAGTKALGIFPTMTVTVKDKQIARWTNINGNVSTRSFKSYMVTTSLLVPGDKIRVKFVNDAYVPGISDRNLTVDAIVVNGLRYESEAPTVTGKGVYSPLSKKCTSGNLQTETLNCNGFFEYTL